MADLLKQINAGQSVRSRGGIIALKNQQSIAILDIRRDLRTVAHLDKVSIWRECEMRLVRTKDSDDMNVDSLQMFNTVEIPNFCPQFSPKLKTAAKGGCK
jgi:hypothetical protein